VQFRGGKTRITVQILGSTGVGIWMWIDGAKSGKMTLGRAG
jgi:hypothetical protein